MRLPLRIAIVGEHPRFREGVRSLLDLQPDLDVVAEVEHLDEVMSVLAAVPCDVLLLYVAVSAQTLPLVRAIAGRVGLIAVLTSGRREDGLAVIRAGARGVLFERFAIDALVEAIRTVAAGHAWVPPALQADIVDLLARPLHGVLTAREREVTHCVGLGLRNGEVARQLAISEQTVKKHLYSIFHKLGVRDRVELILYAKRFDLLAGAAGPAASRIGLAGASAGLPIGSHHTSAAMSPQHAARLVRLVQSTTQDDVGTQPELPPEAEKGTAVTPSGASGADTLSNIRKP